MTTATKNFINSVDRVIIYYDIYRETFDGKPVEWVVVYYDSCACKDSFNGT